MAANSTDAAWSQANSEEPDGSSGKKKGLNLSFNKRIVLVMLAVSLITVLSSIVVLSFVWEQHFQTYTREMCSALPIPRPIPSPRAIRLLVAIGTAAP